MLLRKEGHREAKHMGKKYQIPLLFVLESNQKHNLVQMLMFMCVSRCATVCIHTELLSCPASVAGGSGAQAAEAQGDPAACTEPVMQIPNCCQALFLLQYHRHGGQYYI